MADDSAIYREGIARAIGAHDELELVGAFADGGALVEVVRERGPDVAVVDWRMPGVDGLEACARIACLDPPARTRVVVLSGEMDGELAARARAVGAHAFLSKAASRREICAAILDLARQ